MKKEHEDALVPNHQRWDENCPACQNFDKRMAQRLGVPFVTRMPQGETGPPDAKVLMVRWASRFGEPEDYKRAVEELRSNPIVQCTEARS